MLYVDVVELCGGQGGVLQVLIRRRHHRGFRPGLNLDLKTGVDLSDDRELSWVWKYFETCEPYIVVMAAPCVGLAGFKEVN